jgi:hypothetical protein
MDRTVCDGLDGDVITNTQCTVPLSKLQDYPFDLLLGYKIYVKVVATNDYGDSLISEAGSGDGLETIADAPVDLLNDPSVTDDSTVRFTWSDGPLDGDSIVLDYRVTYDQSTGNFVTLADGVTD